MRIAMVCLVGLVLSVGVGAEPVVEGRVRLVSGDAVVGAQVLVVDLADWRRYGVATTDGAGAFALSLEALEGFDRNLGWFFRIIKVRPTPLTPLPARKGGTTSVALAALAGTPLLLPLQGRGPGG